MTEFLHLRTSRDFGQGHLPPPIIPMRKLRVNSSGWPLSELLLYCSPWHSICVSLTPNAIFFPATSSDETKYLKTVLSAKHHRHDFCYYCVICISLNLSLYIIPLIFTIILWCRLWKDYCPYFRENVTEIQRSDLFMLLPCLKPFSHSSVHSDKMLAIWCYMVILTPIISSIFKNWDIVDLQCCVSSGV